ncbi:MAG: 16S rRNA (guanine(527)-N(7))-methyltransferase RsmG [Pseudomonadales bacterium]|nr:16S rRNA (guanine(527)-N(7))-methyltransferase RsmG [Pseudomonadales bacterium]
MDTSLENRLQRGCDALGLECDAGHRQQLLAYLQLLHKWNAAYNLTAVRDPEQMVTRHLLDSLAVAPYLPAGNAIDVGTGAGLPGVPLAIVFPQRQFALLDSNGKKTRFLFQVKTALSLDNMQVHHQRVESFQPSGSYDVVLSRAYASLRDMVSSCRHLLAPGGRFLAMKGSLDPGELEQVAASCEVLAVHALAVPGLNEQRHLLDLALRQVAAAQAGQAMAGTQNRG